MESWKMYENPNMQKNTYPKVSFSQKCLAPVPKWAESAMGDRLHSLEMRSFDGLPFTQAVLWQHCKICCKTLTNLERVRDCMCYCERVKSQKRPVACLLWTFSRSNNCCLSLAGVDHQWWLGVTTLAKHRHQDVHSAIVTMAWGWNCFLLL